MNINAILENSQMEKLVLQHPIKDTAILRVEYNRLLEILWELDKQIQVAYDDPGINPKVFNELVNERKKVHNKMLNIDKLILTKSGFKPD